MLQSDRPLDVLENVGQGWHSRQSASARNIEGCHEEHFLFSDLVFH